MPSSLGHKLKPVKQGSFFCAPACLYNLLVHCFLPDGNAVFSRQSSTYAPTTRFLLICSAPPVSFLRHMVIIRVFKGLGRVNRINVTTCRKTMFTELQFGWGEACLGKPSVFTLAIHIAQEGGWLFDSPASWAWAGLLFSTLRTGSKLPVYFPWAPIWFLVDGLLPFHNNGMILLVDGWQIC